MPLRLFVDRLKGSHEEVIDTSIESAHVFVSQEDRELCSQPLQVHLKAYLAGKELVIELVSIKAPLKQTCIVCNEAFTRDVEVKDLRHVIATSAIKGAVYNAAELVRDEICLALEEYPECNGKCPERAALKEYLK